MITVYVIAPLSVACGPGKYRSHDDSTCKSCPLNSESHLAAASECRCLSGYFRAPSEGASTACSGLLFE